MALKQLNIKNRTYYFYNDLFNIKDFDANNLKLDKEKSMSLGIYYIGYVDKKPKCNANSVNFLYLMNNRIDGFIELKNGDKYLNISDAVRNSEVLKEYSKVWNRIKDCIKKINNREGEYDKGFMKIKFNSDDEQFIRNIFVKDGKYYPQCFLDKCLYEV